MVKWRIKIGNVYNFHELFKIDGNYEVFQVFILERGDLAFNKFPRLIPHEDFQTYHRALESAQNMFQFEGVDEFKAKTSGGVDVVFGRGVRQLFANHTCVT